MLGLRKPIPDPYRALHYRGGAGTDMHIGGTSGSSTGASEKRLGILYSQSRQASPPLPISPSNPWLKWKGGASGTGSSM